MSGDHNQAQVTREPPSQIDIEQMSHWNKHWSEEWIDEMEEAVQANDKFRVALLCHKVHKQAFYDGFAAKLSGVKDE